MIRKIIAFTLSLICVTGIQSCDDNTNPVAPDPEPEVVGCEAAAIYDWDSVEFSTTLDQNDDVWIAFDISEITLFSIYLDQAGFNCGLYNGCEGEYGAGDPVYAFESVGNGLEVGILPEGEYWLNLVNTRNRVDFIFSIDLNDIVYGCMDNNAQNYNSDANVDDASCVLTDCTTEYWVENYGECVNDCNGNCSPTSWIGDGWCDQGDWGVYDEDGEIVAINLWCEEFAWDGGDCEEIADECTAGQVFDCNGNCAPEDWVGDGYCDNGAYSFGGNDIFFDCEEFNNDEGDCEGLMRMNLDAKYPNGRQPYIN